MSQKLKFAIKLAKEAGRIIIEGLDRAVIKKSKADKRDICSNIDRETEKMIRAKIKRTKNCYKKIRINF